MADTIQDMAASISDLAGAMAAAESASTGLGRAFADASAENLIWTTAARILSGSGLWRLQARIRAVGGVLQLYYDAQEKTRKEELESIKTVSTLIESREDLERMVKGGVKSNDKLYKVYKRVYGAELAKEKIEKEAAETLKKTNKLIEEHTTLSDKDFKRKLEMNKEFLKGKSLRDAQNKTQAHMNLLLHENEVLEINMAELQRAREMPATNALEAEQKKLAIQEEQFRIEEQKLHLEETRAGATEAMEEETKLKTIIVEVAEGEEEANSWVKRKLPAPVRKAVKHIRYVGTFIKKIHKVFWMVLRSAAMALLQGMLYLGIIILAVIMLKPLFFKMWDMWKDTGNRFGTVWAFIKSRWEAIQPSVTKAWSLMKSFFVILADPKSTIKDMLIAYMKMVGQFLVVFLRFAIEFVIPIAFKLFYNITLFLIKAIFKILAFLIKLTWTVIKFIFNMFNKEYRDKVFAKLVEFKDKIIVKLLAWAGTIWIQLSTWFGVQKVAMKLWVSDMIVTIKTWLRTEWNKIVDRFPGVSETYNFIKWVSGNLATGGTVLSSGNFIVGERGPEIVSLPGGAVVTPNHMINQPTINNITVQVQGRIGASDSEIRDIAKKVGALVSREINRTTSSAVRM